MSSTSVRTKAFLLVDYSYGFSKVWLYIALTPQVEQALEAIGFYRQDVKTAKASAVFRTTKEVGIISQSRIEAALAVGNKPVSKPKPKARLTLKELEERVSMLETLIEEMALAK